MSVAWAGSPGSLPFYDLPRGQLPRALQEGIESVRVQVSLTRRATPLPVPSQGRPVPAAGPVQDGGTERAALRRRLPRLHVGLGGRALQGGGGQEHDQAKT